MITMKRKQYDLSENESGEIVMFQGRNFRIRCVSKNRYEFRDAYSLIYGTSTEVLELISKHMNDAKTSVIELTLAKRKLHEEASEACAKIPEPVKPVEILGAKRSFHAEKERRASRAAACGPVVGRSRWSHGVQIVACATTKKRRRSGLHRATPSNA